jgi:glycosyltransferase involved in cell wall biosynthesis
LHIPVVVSVAGGELTQLDDIGYGLQRSAFSRWTVGQALRGADRVVVACEYVRRLISTAGYGIADDMICTIVLGVDTNVFCPDGAPSSPKRLIHVGSLIGVKDQATLLKALARLDSSATLDIVGEGPERPRLEALTAELGIAKRVTFCGAVAHPDLPNYYRRAALNILCSRHEALGMVTLEAAACGVPTVSTRVGLVPDYEGRLGVSVAVGDDVALAEAINNLLNYPDEVATLAGAAKDAVNAQFTIEHTVAQLRAMYQEVQAQ